jgi:preprotein translocase subunit SecF
MAEYFKQFFQTGNPSSNEFNQGYIAAIAVILLVLLLVLVLRLILGLVFRRKSCHGITVKQEKGDVFVSRSAVDTVVKSLKSDFKHIKIAKVTIRGNKNSQHIRIYLDFENSGGGLPPQSADLQTRVLEALKKNFGIDSVRKVHITLREIKMIEGATAEKPEAGKKEPSNKEAPQKADGTDSGIPV